VLAGNGWKSTLAIAPKNSSQRVVEMSGRPASSENNKSDDPTILTACKDDIIGLWEDPVVRGLCSSKLLANATIILISLSLFLLRVPVVKYFPSYGDAPNDVENVTRCEFDGLYFSFFTFKRYTDFRDKFQS
jgi:hypothetical protein